MASTVDLTKCFDDEAGYHEIQSMQQLQGLHAGIHSLYEGLFDDTNPEYLGYLSTHRTHLSVFDQTALPSPSLSYQRSYHTRMNPGCPSASQHEDLHHGFDALGADGGMQHMPDLLLSERGHAQACNLDVGCEAHHTIHYSGVIDGEDELSSCPRGASSVKRGSGGSSGAPTPVRGESDKKRIKRENSGSQTPVQQASKTATTPASTDKKGLRSFSGQVCQKVRDKKTTTYNEVADELVKDFALSELNEELKYDEKNIRRRVYDALNVLMALEIISKDKKSISWRGFPSSCCESDEQDALVDALARAEVQREEHEAQLENLILQYVSTANLLKRNKADGARLDEAAGQPGCHRNYMPFVLVSAPSNAQIDVKLRDTQDKLHVKMTCPFQLHNDNSIIGVMNLCPLKEDLLPILGSRALVNFIIARRPDLFPSDALPDSSKSADSSEQAAHIPFSSLPSFVAVADAAPATPNASSFDCRPPHGDGTSSVKNQSDAVARR